MSDTRSSDESQPDIPSDASNAEDAVSQASDADQHLRFITHDTITDEGHRRLDKDVMDSDVLELLIRYGFIIPGQSLQDESSGRDNRADILAKICATAAGEGTLDLNATKAKELISQHPRLGEMVDRSWVEGKGFKDIRRLALLRREIPHDMSNIQSKPGDYLYEASVKATENSWKQRFAGRAHVALKSHIMHYQTSITNSYAPHCAIVQSTGTGKSKTVDEFSKHDFVIPINLRKPRAGGFPASDERVYDFLEPGYLSSMSPDLLWAHMKAFMFALLEKCEKVIVAAMLCHGDSHETRLAWLRNEGAAWFREMMTEGQTVRAQGDYRVKFYEDVVNRAQQLSDDAARALKAHSSLTFMKRGSSPVQIQFASAADRSVVAKAESLIRHWGFSNKKLDAPIVYLAFDEAHSLSRPDAQPTAQIVLSPFSHLRKILRSCRDLPLFAIFLSTTGKITQFVLPKEDDDSDRLQSGELVLIPPFCALGWDQCAAPFPTDQMDLSYVSSLAYKARLGRPLFASRYAAGLRLEEMEREELLKSLVEFAAKKLIKFDLASWPSELSPKQELACLSARLPIEFMSSTSTESTKDERDQIANHMRVCLSVDESFRKFTSLNPSEPIVSEGAYLLMNNSRIRFHAPAALSRVLTGFSVHQGDRGELVVLLALTMARDRVVSQQRLRIQDGVFGVVPFLEALITRPSEESGRFCDVLKIKPSVYINSNDKNVTLEKAFAEVNLHFNHFVKRQQQNNLDEETTKGFIARCAAIMAANSQGGYDAALITVRGNAVVVQSTKGLFIIQVKNDTHYTATVEPLLFDKMDPVSMGFIGPKKTLETPIIRVVFALAAARPAIRYVETQKQGNFTSYDIWIAGLSPEVLAVIAKQDQAIWDTLLSASRGWEKMYQHWDPTTVSLLKNMAPMVADAEDFWGFRNRKPEDD